MIDRLCASRCTVRESGLKHVLMHRRCCRLHRLLNRIGKFHLSTGFGLESARRQTQGGLHRRSSSNERTHRWRVCRTAPRILKARLCRVKCAPLGASNLRLVDSTVRFIPGTTGFGELRFYAEKASGEIADCQNGIALSTQMNSFALECVQPYKAHAENWPHGSGDVSLALVQGEELRLSRLSASVPANSAQSSISDARLANRSPLA